MTCRIFVGCAPNHEDAESQAVLEWSVRKHSSMPVEINWMKLSNNPKSAFFVWDTRHWATPFSGFRWAVPSLCSYHGKAIYMDSDFIVLDDIAKLWNQEFQKDKIIIAKGGSEWRICCSMWDCRAAEPYIAHYETLRASPDSHHNMTKFLRGSDLVQSFEGDWNNLDARAGERLCDISALHYTNMASQPQLEYAIPRLAANGQRHWYDAPTKPHPREDVRSLFAELLQEAGVNGYPVSRYTTGPTFGEVDKQQFRVRF